MEDLTLGGTALQQGAFPAVETPIASLRGQKVIPSPYGRQRPRMIVAPPEWLSRNSSTSRDFPTPGRADHRHEATRSVGRDSLERLRQHFELVLAADER